MKRKYEVVRADVMRNHLALKVIVHELGPMWSIELKVPFAALDARLLYEAWEVENCRQVAWERRQRERLDDSLF